MKTSRRHIYMTLFCLYIIALGLMCFIRPENIPSNRFDLFGIPADKAGHFLMFLPFPIISFAAFSREGEKSFSRAICRLSAITASGAAIAIGTEITQKFLGYRSFDIMDFACDAAGLISGAAAAAVYIAIKIRQK